MSLKGSNYLKNFQEKICIFRFQQIIVNTEHLGILAHPQVKLLREPAKIHQELNKKCYTIWSNLNMIVMDELQM